MTGTYIKIKLQAYDKKLIEKSAEDIVNTAKKFGGAVRGPVPLPRKIRKYTVLRSPFIDKKSREQFEMRIHKRLIQIDSPETSVVEGLQKISLPPGVSIGISLAGEQK